jgi:hypothetical protein
LSQYTDEKFAQFGDSICSCVKTASDEHISTAKGDSHDTVNEPAQTVHARHLGRA